MANSIIGKVLSIGQTNNVSTKGEFLKRDLALDCTRYDSLTGEPRENYVQLSFQGKHCALLDDFKPGELVEVSFILNGRKYDGGNGEKIITDIVGYKIERRGKQQPKEEATPAPTPEQPAEGFAKIADDPATIQPNKPVDPAKQEELPF